jgi:GNAT superfamily N-acetyltransferase
LTPRIEKLQPLHVVEAFDCSNQDLNRFLQKYALQNQSSGASTTYVGLADQTVIGYYSLAVGSVEYEQAPARVTKGLAHHPIPVMLLARLAVDQQWQRKGVGAGLLKDAMLRTLQAADIVGIRAVLVHAKNHHATLFSQHFDFIPSPSDPLHLLILMKDVRRILA